MQITNYNLYSEKFNIIGTKLNFSIIYEIIKKYVADIKLENM